MTTEPNLPLVQWGNIDHAAMVRPVKVASFSPAVAGELGPEFGLPSAMQAAFNQLISETIAKERDAVTALQAFARVTGDTRGVEVVWETGYDGDRATMRFSARLSDDVPADEVRQRADHSAIWRRHAPASGV